MLRTHRAFDLKPLGRTTNRYTVIEEEPPPTSRRHRIPRPHHHHPAPTEGEPAHFIEHLKYAASKQIHPWGISRDAREERAVTRTVLVGDLDVEEEEVEAVGVGADELGEHPVEGGAAADGGVRVPLERRLVHRHHHPRRR